MSYRVIQRQPHIAMRIDDVFDSYSELLNEVVLAGFSVEDYVIERECRLCYNWFEPDAAHRCCPVLTESTNRQPSELSFSPLSQDVSPQRERQPRRRHRNIRWFVILEDYIARPAVSFALGLGLMVSSRPARYSTDTTIVVVYGARKRVHQFQGYVDRVNS